MKKYKVEIDTKVTGQKDVDKLNDSLEDTQQEQEGVNEGFNEMGGAADAALGGAVSKFKGFKTAIQSSVKSLGVLKVAVAATGLGLLLLTIASIKAAFTSTEAGQNKFAKLMSALGVITGNLTDLLADLGNTIIAVFENPQQALKDFWEALKQNVVVRVNSVIEMFGLLGKAVKQVFEGDFSGAMDSAKQAGSKYIDAMTGVEDSINKATTAVTGFIDETVREIAVMNELSDTQARIDKMVRTQLVERARLEGVAADALLSALDVDKYTSEQRLVFLQQAAEATDKIFEQEQIIAAERLRIRQEQNKLAGSTKDDLLEEAQLEADLIRLTKERSNAQKRIFTQQLAARKEFNAEKSGLDEEDLEYLETQLDEEMLLLQDGEDAKIEMWKNTSKQKKAISLQDAQVVLGAASSLFGALADLSEGNFEQQKKFQIAEAVTSTISGAISAFMGGVSTIPGPFGVALGAVLAAATLASGYANVKKIKATKPDGSSGGGGGFSGGSGSIPSAAPTLSLIEPATAGENQISQQLVQSTEPTKAYVVSNDMTSQQEMDRRIENTATI